MKSLMLSLGFIASLLVASCVGQRLTTGRCPSFTPAAAPIVTLSFNPLFEYAVTKGVFSRNWKCTSVNIIEVNPIALYAYTAIGINPLTKARVTGSGTIVPTDPLGIFLSGDPSAYITVTGDRDPFSRCVRYQLHTVGGGFFVLYHCRNLPFGKIDSVSVLSTTATPDAVAIAAINLALRNLGYEEKDYHLPFENGCS